MRSILVFAFVVGLSCLGYAQRTGTTSTGTTTTTTNNSGTTTTTTNNGGRTGTGTTTTTTTTNPQNTGTTTTTNDRTGTGTTTTTTNSNQNVIIDKVVEPAVKTGIDKVSNGTTQDVLNTASDQLLNSPKVNQGLDNMMKGNGKKGGKKGK